MSDDFRLVFSGEVTEGQHPAVVKKRLAAVLKLDDARMDVMFSGKAVVVKKQTDEKTAARYQAVFEKAGARLRVLPLEEGVSPASESARPDPANNADKDADPQQAEQETQTEDGGLQVMPVGADLVSREERGPEAPAAMPDVDHLTLAELGAQLGQGTAEVVVAEITVEFDLAEVGAIIGEVDRALPELAVPDVDFELAEPGARMSDAAQPPPAEPPDTSHLSLDDEEPDSK